MKLPVAFEEKMKDLLGEEFQDYIDCYEEKRYYGLRVNTLKISVEDFQKICPWELEPIPWIENGFYYDGDSIQPAKHPYYAAGLYYLQEPSAMTPANRLPVQPREKVLDVCAAPGGKATELASKLGREGVLAANDISSSRAKGLLKNLELSGVGNLLVLSEEPGKLISYFREYFDKILIDAPCSGEGMFRKEKRMVKAWEEHGPEFFSKIQKSIIAQAAEMLKPGGMILYSTCTFDRRENEETILSLLEQFPEFEICEMKGYEGFRPGIPKDDREDLVKTVRIFPHCMKGEGHYLALLKKGSEGCENTETNLERQKKQTVPGSAGGLKKIPEELEEFLGHLTLPLDPSRLDLKKERVYYMPAELPDLKGIRFLRTGLLLGELKKNRFEPSQALAMYLKMEEYDQVLNLSVEDERVHRYLKGETLDVSDLCSNSGQKKQKAGSGRKQKDKGWSLVCVDGYPLGWGKLASGTLKNKYLPGWRWQS